MRPDHTDQPPAPTEVPDPWHRPTDDTSERAQFILGALSLAIWLIVAFGLATIFGVTQEDDTPHIMTAGGIAFMCAALPWVYYPRLIERLKRRRGTQ